MKIVAIKCSIKMLSVTLYSNRQILTAVSVIYPHVQDLLRQVSVFHKSVSVTCLKLNQVDSL